MSEKENQEVETTQVKNKKEDASYEASAPIEDTQETSVESPEEAEVLPSVEELLLQNTQKDAEIERLKTALIAGDKDIKELQSRLRTVSAAYKKEKEDQEDFKGRVQRQMEYRESRRRGEVVKVLFEPLENLRRSETVLSKKDPESAKGIEMVVKAFMKGFTELGLEEIEPTGQKLDPNEHQALMMQPTEDPALDEVVLQTFAVGYKIEGLVLKAAQVIVGKYDGPPSQEENDGDHSPENSSNEDDSDATTENVKNAENSDVENESSEDSASASEQ